jgi:DNA-binding NarL/FixJ family response regulator
MRRTTVLIADDHSIVREGLVSLLNDAYEVVGDVGDGEALLAEAKRLRPDVIVTDMSMPGMSGLDVLSQLAIEGVQSKVIVLTMYSDPELATQAIRAGASGFLLKQSACEEILSAIEQVLQGHLYLASALTKGVLARIADPGHTGEVQLTARQREVLKLLAEGRRMKEIAGALQLSPRTVESHKYEIMQVLGLHSTAELVRYALQHRFIAE